MTNTVSFCILNDLCPAYGPVHKSFDVSTGDNLMEITNAVTDILTQFKNQGYDPSGYYYQYINNNEIREIAADLLNDGYYVWNRFEKYYVIAFALNYTRFEVFSKDYDKELIKWRDNDENDVMKGKIEDDDYNENPVITLMKNLL